MRKFALSMVLLIGGCCAYPGSGYVAADESTYNYAQPKLVQWALFKGGDWPIIVKNKGIAWKARIDRAKHVEEAGSSE